MHPPPQAFYVIYDGAIYLHQGASYYCTSLDLGARVARVRPARSAKHYTSVQASGGCCAVQSCCAVPVPLPCAKAPSGAACVSPACLRFARLAATRQHKLTCSRHQVL